MYQINVLKTARRPAFGQLEEIAEGMVDIDEFVVRGGDLIPVDQTENENSDRKPVMTGAREPVF